MTDVFLFPGQASPNDVRLRDPTIATPKRFWRATFGADVSGSVATGVNTLEWRIAGVDQVGSGTALASSEHASTAFPATLAFDGDVSTRWVSDTTPTPHWIQYDFGAGANKLITSLRIVTNDDTTGPSSVLVQSSPDGVTLTTEFYVEGLTQASWTGNSYVQGDDSGITWFIGAVAATLFSSANTFYSPTVTTGPVDLAASLFANTQTYFTQTVTPGAVGLTPSLFASSQTFYTQTLSATCALTPSLFANAQTFYTQTVTTGAVGLTPSLFANSQTFYTQVVTTGVVDLAPSLFAASQTYYTQTVTAGAVALVPSLFANAQTYYTQAISQDGAPQALTADVFENAQTFFAQSIVGDTAPVVVELEPHGGYPDYIPVKRDKRKTLDEERQEIRALLRKALGDEDTPEAAAVVDLARPFVRVPRPGGLKVDWTGIEAHLGELRTALAAYRAAVQDEDDEEDEMMMLAMAA